MPNLYTEIKGKYSLPKLNYLKSAESQPASYKNKFFLRRPQLLPKWKDLTVPSTGMFSEVPDSQTPPDRFSEQKVVSYAVQLIFFRGDTHLTTTWELVLLLIMSSSKHLFYCYCPIIIFTTAVLIRELA